MATVTTAALQPLFDGNLTSGDDAALRRRFPDRAAAVAGLLRWRSLNSHRPAVTASLPKGHRVKSRLSGRVRALVFDFDGLIIDSESPDYASWAEVFASRGCDLPLDLWVAAIGTAGGTLDLLGLLERRLGRPVDRPAIRAERRGRFLQLVAAQPILPGVETYLAQAGERGLLRAVASSASRGWVVGQLDRLGLMGAFDSILCQDDVSRAKPDPELYADTLRRLGVHPGEAVAFEDSPNGIEAAVGAGLFCVAVPNAMTLRLDLSRADLILASLAEIPLCDLIARIEGFPPHGQPDPSQGLP